MDKVRMVCGVLCAAVLTFAVILIPMTGMGQNPSAEPSSQASAGYTVRDYQGKIAVFEGSAQEPSQVLSIETATFPQEDQQLLKVGIHAASKADLQRILEDYSEYRFLFPTVFFFSFFIFSPSPFQEKSRPET